MARPPLRRQDASIPSGLPGRVAPGVVQVAPGADIPSGTAITRGLIGRIEGLRSTVDSMADREAQEAAWNAGTVAGEAEPGTQMEGGGVLYRTAFNRAAADIAARRLEIEAEQTLQRLLEEHRADPDGFNAAAAAWRNGAAERLPPAIRASFLTRFDARALPYSAQVREGLRRRLADDALATFVEAEPARRAAIERAAGQAVTDPAAAAALRAEEQHYLAQLVALGPREAFRIGDRQYPADPSRAGVLSAAEIAGRWQQVEEARDVAAADAARRAVGGGYAWIADFERNAGGMAGSPLTQREAAQGRVLAGVDRLAARLPESWRPVVAEAARQTGLPVALLAALIGLESGGRADAVSRAGAVGPAQIMPETARNPGLGMAPLPEDALRDPARAIPWAAQYLARLRDRYQGDLGLALAAYNYGMGNVDRAIAGDGRLPQETRDYLATLLPAAGGGGGLPADRVARIAGRLRALVAAEEQIRAEGRAEARAELNRVVAENLAAIAETGEATRPLDPSLVARAGEDLDRLVERERAARAAFVAQRIARDTTDPAELARLAEEFAPGTANFTADPHAAVALRARLRQRGAQVAGAALDERVRDLDAEAAATGQAGEISEEEARAAGITPERRAAINAALALRAEGVRLRQAALAMPEGERQAALDALPVAGPDARENAERVRVLADAFADRDRAVREDAALYALTGLPRAARDLAGRAAAGEPEALRDLAGLLAAEQERLGVPQALRRPLPRSILEPLLARVLDAPGPDEALQALSALTGAIGVPEAARALAATRVTGDAQEPRRRAVAVAASLLEQQPDTARRILAGQLFLRDNPLPAATPAQRTAATQAALGEAFELRPQALADVEAAALALYAARRDLSPQAFSARAWRDALAELVPVTEFGGRVTVLPPGMDAARFRALMSALPPERLDGARAADGRPITPEMVARGGFQALAIGPGRYVLRYGAFEVEDGRNPGRAFVLDVTGAEPAAAPPRPVRRGSLGAGVRRIEGWDDEP
jgi:soluble lytic murein transglycosylase-like protein